MNCAFNLTRNAVEAKSMCLRRDIPWVLFAVLCAANFVAAQDSASTLQSVRFSDAQITTAFAQTCNGFSSDELIITDKLRCDFLATLSGGVKCSAQEETTALLQLLRLRKAGNLKTKATSRGPRVDADIAPVAEIAARVVTDRHKVTTDTLMANPVFRQELQTEAEKLHPGVSAYAVRKSVLQLRKKRALKPELVLRVADWERVVVTYGLAELNANLSQNKIAQQPGVYLFRDSSGYLYIGEASDMAKRLSQHLNESDRPSLAEHLSSNDPSTITVELHLFPNDSPAKKVTVRRAYESELIRSREPKFNARP